MDIRCVWFNRQKGVCACFITLYTLYYPLAEFFKFGGDDSADCSTLPLASRQKDSRVSAKLRSGSNRWDRVVLGGQLSKTSSMAHRIRYSHKQKANALFKMKNLQAHTAGKFCLSIFCHWSVYF